jgi:hypothetical protein
MSHISDHSASNHRVQVAVHILSRGQDYFRWVAGQNTDVNAGEHCSDGSVKNDLGHKKLELRLQSISFLHGLLTDSQMLLLLRPGHEALWYYRRSMFSMLLIMVYGMQRCSPCGDSSFDSVNEVVSSDGWGVFPDITPSSNGTTPILFNSTDNAHIFSDQTAVMATESRDLLLRCSQDTCSSCDVLRWLALQLRFESTLCQWCISVRDVVWDGKLQRLMATRYCAFVFDVVRFVWCLISTLFLLRYIRCLNDPREVEMERLLIFMGCACWLGLE